MKVLIINIQLNNTNLVNLQFQIIYMVFKIFLLLKNQLNLIQRHLCSYTLIIELINLLPLVIDNQYFSFYMKLFN